MTKKNYSSFGNVNWNSKWSQASAAG